MAEPEMARGASAPDGVSECPNCGAEAGTGRFCAECGQVLRPVRRGLASYAREAFENVLSADTKTLRSLFSIVMRPGALAEGAASNRGAYTINPVKLFFAVIVAYTLFFAVSPVKYAQMWVGAGGELGWDMSALSEEDIAAGYDAAVFVQFFVEPRDHVLEPALGERIRSGALAPDFWPAIAPLVRVSLDPAAEARFIDQFPLLMAYSALLIGLPVTLLNLIIYRRKRYVVDHALVAFEAATALPLIIMAAGLVMSLLYLAGLPIPRDPSFNPVFVLGVLPVFALWLVIADRRFYGSHWLVAVIKSALCLGAWYAIMQFFSIYLIGGLAWVVS